MQPCFVTEDRNCKLHFDDAADAEHRARLEAAAEAAAINRLTGRDPHACCVRCGQLDCTCRAVATVAPDRSQWLLDRQRGIGSSDAPNLVGVGYRSAVQVYHEKTNPPDTRMPAAGVLRRGLDLEGIIATRYAETVGVPLLARGLIDRHPERPWQLASLDRVRDDDRPVELKTTAGFGADWGPSGSDIVPDGYQVQVQHQMGVVGADWCDLAALDVIAWEFRVYRIPFSPTFFDWLTGIEAEFWQRYVLPRTPPGPEWSERFEADARAQCVRGKTVELVGAAELLEQRKALAAIRDEADAEYKRLTARVEAMLGDAEAGVCGPWRVRRVNVKAHHVEAHDKPASSYIRATMKGGA